MRLNHVDQAANPTFSAHAPAANTAAVVTVAASAENFHVLDWIIWSYSEAPTAGQLTVTINSVTVFQVDVTAAGPGAIRFDPPLYSAAQTLNQAMVVTLAAGGGTTLGKLNIRYR